MEENTVLLSSRGLLKSCTAHNARPLSSNPAIDEDLLGRLRPGGSLYVCTDALPSFAREWLPRIATPFTLVSGDSDLSVSPATLGETVFSTLLANEFLRAWYAQNCASGHPKLFRIPIGLDYHTMFEKPGFWGLTAVSPIAQERQLLNTWASSPDITQRYFAAYCNWTTSLERGDRRICLERIDRSVCFLEPSRITRASSWARQSEFIFVVSPEGAGMDCHRTWEAIALGCIPIVKRNALAELLAELPAMIVDDWAEVRRDRLEAYLRDFGGRTFDYSLLLRAAWLRRIHGQAENPPLRMSYADFRRLMTRQTG